MCSGVDEDVLKTNSAKISLKRCILHVNTLYCIALHYKNAYINRYITIGLIDDIACVIMNVYTEREEAIRIISARKATKQEREMYYDYS